MADKIIRVLAKDAPVKASAITAKEMVERARQIHKTLPVATAALGRSLMAASMMGNQLKEKDGSVTLRIKEAARWAASPWCPTARATPGAMWSIPWWTSP